MIHVLNLPKPSSDLVKLVISAADNRPINHNGKLWHQAIQGSDLNCAAGEFFIDYEVMQLAKKEFSSFINVEFMAMVGVIRNVDRTSVACYPPHVDNGRTIAINNYIKLGGNDVKTVIYDKSYPMHMRPNDRANVLTYAELNKIEEYTLNSDAWYILDTTQYHSVENIESDRIILTLSIKDRDFDDAIDIFSEIIKN